MFCKHKYGKIEEDGYQYCEKCGKANKIECDHKWKKIGKLTRNGWSFNSISGIVYVLECEKCGNIKKVEID